MDICAYYETDRQVEDHIIDAVLEQIGSTPQTDSSWFGRARNVVNKAAVSANQKMKTRNTKLADEKVIRQRAEQKAKTFAYNAAHKKLRRKDTRQGSSWGV
jgi:hypothetical protein